MYCFWTQFRVQFQFLKKLKHMMLGADYMEVNQSVDRPGLFTKTCHSLVLHEIFISLAGDTLFEKIFEFQRKQPVTKGSTTSNIMLNRFCPISTNSFTLHPPPPPLIYQNSNKKNVNFHFKSVIVINNHFELSIIKKVN